MGLDAVEFFAEVAWEGLLLVVSPGWETCCCSCAILLSISDDRRSRILSQRLSSTLKIALLLGHRPLHLLERRSSLTSTSYPTVCRLSIEGCRELLGAALYGHRPLKHALQLRHFCGQTPVVYSLLLALLGYLLNLLGLPPVLPGLLL